MVTPLAADQRWSLDFVSDQLTDGRRFRILAVVDDCTPAPSPARSAGTLRYAGAPRPGLLPPRKHKVQINPGLSPRLDEKRGSRQLRSLAQVTAAPGGADFFSFVWGLWPLIRNRCFQATARLASVLT
jgi:hypothetical protein